MYFDYICIKNSKYHKFLHACLQRAVFVSNKVHMSANLVHYNLQIFFYTFMVIEIILSRFKSTNPGISYHRPLTTSYGNFIDGRRRI